MFVGLVHRVASDIQEPLKVKEAAERPAQNGNGNHKAVTSAPNHAQYTVITCYYQLLS